MKDSAYLIEEYKCDYTDAENSLWKKIFKKQYDYIKKYACKDYLEGFENLNLSSSSIPNISDINTSLKENFNWELIPVTGILPDKLFFEFVSNRKFPITLSIRGADEIEFSKLPDIFHDLFGHTPMLMNKPFGDFTQKFGEAALKYFDNKPFLLRLGRLYWFTLETGLIFENGRYKLYGGALMTSSKEIKNVYNSESTIHNYDIYDIFKNDYNNLKIQKEYYVIDNFNSLLNSIDMIDQSLMLLDNNQLLR